MIDQLYLRKIYFLFPIVVVLFPLFPSYLSGYLGEQIVFIVAFFCVWLFGKISVYKIALTYNECFYFIYFFCAIVFSLICDIFRGNIISSDFYEISRPVVFLFFFGFYKRSNLPVNQLELITYRSLSVLFGILAVYSILEFLLPEQIELISHFLYKRENSSILLNKAIGSFYQTYTFAYLLLLSIIFLFISFLYKMNLGRLCLFLLFLFVLLLTQSRSMYITSFIAMFVCFLIPFLYRDVKSSIRILFFATVITSGIVFYFSNLQDVIQKNFPYAYSGIDAMIEGNNNSVNNRASQIDWAIENNVFVFIGAGISKGVMIQESFYSLYYYRYGIVGICLYLILIFYISLKSYKIAGIEFLRRNDRLGIIYLSLSLFYAITPIALLSSVHQDTPKISLLFYGLMGLVLNKHSTLKINKTLG
jgi:hypothetical protein